MSKSHTLVIEKEFKKYHTVADNAPCEWSKALGATHTLLIDWDGSTRPARLLKTVMYVGVDEVANDIVWQKWQVKVVKD